MLAPPSVVMANTSTTKTKALRITITPNAKRPGHYDARLQNGCVIIQASRQTFLDAVRALIGRGADPSIILEMWRDGAAQCALRARLGVVAAFDVRETAFGPALRRELIGRPPTCNSTPRIRSEWAQEAIMQVPA